jgi:hypothetical protein
MLWAFSKLAEINEPLQRALFEAALAKILQFSP